MSAVRVETVRIGLLSALLIACVAFVGVGVTEGLQAAVAAEEYARVFTLIVLGVSMVILPLALLHDAVREWRAKA